MLSGLNKISRIIVISAFFALLIICASQEIKENDTWLHLRTGQFISENGYVPKSDIYSFTMAGKGWVNHEWLSQIIFYKIYSIFGINGLIFMRIFIIMASFALLLGIGYRRNTHLFIVLMALLALLAAQARFFVRPELFTLFFVAFYLFILERYIKTRYLYLLPFIQILWANTHGYYLLGPLFLLIYAASGAVGSRANIRRFLFVSAIVFAASFFTPNLQIGVLYPLKAIAHISGTSNIFLNTIAELISPFGKEVFGIYVRYNWYRLLILISSVLFILNIKRINLRHFVLYLIFLSLSWVANRNIALFSVIALLTSANNINALASGWTAISGYLKKRGMDGYSAVFCNVAIIALFFSMGFKALNAEYYVFDEGRFKKRLFGVRGDHYPEGALDFIESNKVSGNIFNDFNAGGYMIWRLFPEHKVFIDGRTELYGASFYKEYLDTICVVKEWKKVYETYDIQCVLLHSDTVSKGLAKSLLDDKEWELVYLDASGIVFLKDSAKNRGIIEKNRVTPDDFNMYNLKPEVMAELKERKVDPGAHMNLAATFFYLGLYDAALKYLARAEAINITADMPKLKAAIYVGKGLFEDALVSSEMALRYKRNIMDSDVWYNMGCAYSGIGSQDEALESFGMAARLDPIHYSSYERLAEIYYNRKEFEEAARFNIRALEILDGYTIKSNKKVSKLHLSLAVIYDGMAAYDKAEREFDSAISLSHDDPHMYNVAGVFYAKNKRFDEAVRCWRKSLEVDPENKEARENLKKAKRFLK